MHTKTWRPTLIGKSPNAINFREKRITALPTSMRKTTPAGAHTLGVHTANKDFARSVSNILYEKRKSRSETRANSYVENPGYLRSDYLIESNLTRFQTGEGKFALTETVRGHDVFIITDVLSYNQDISLSGFPHVISPDDHYRDLLRIISLCVSKARRINIIMPFVYEGRQDHADSRDVSLDCSAFLKQIHSLGVANLIIFDPHDARITNSVPLMGIELPRSAYKIISTLINSFSSIVLDAEHTTVISPDENGVNRGIFYASMLNLPLGIFYRNKDYSHKVNGINPIINYQYLGDDLNGKDVVIVDDMINSGDTMLRTAAQIKKQNARNIYCLSPFGVFTNGLKDFDKAYEDGIIKAVLCTNLIYRRPELLKRDWYIDVNMSPYVARIIDALNVNESVGKLINSTSRITDLLGQVRIGEIFDEFER